MMMQPQDYVKENFQSSKQVKIAQITEAYQQEMEGRKKTMKRVKQINKEFLDLTHTFQTNVLDKIDELEQLGVLPAEYSKNFSKKILKLSDMVPPIELQASI